jgi:hypothetical protein
LGAGLRGSQALKNANLYPLPMRRTYLAA